MTNLFNLQLMKKTCSYSLRKKLFSGAPVKCVFFMAQITKILLFSGMSLLERSKITV